MFLEKAGARQIKFAHEINVSMQKLYKHENNIIKNIPCDKIEVIARITKTSFSHIMG